MMFAKIAFLITIAQLCVSVTAKIYTSNRLNPLSLNNLVNKDRFRPIHTRATTSTPNALYYELPVNHLDSNSATFLNRYWVDDYFYKPGGPVFFIDNGEATAEGMEIYLRDGASGSLAETFNGLLILWEHRYYGTSMPNMTRDMNFEPEKLATYLRYHTVDQALEDVAVFAKNFKFAGLPNQDLTPGNTPWVFIGGSYPGARAAWARARNPDIFHASLASSAVVQIQENMWQYYHPVEKVMESTGYSNCSADMRALSAYLNTVFDKQNASAADSFMLAITGRPGTNLYRYFNYDNTTDAWEDRRTNLRAAIEVMFQDFQYVGMAGLLGYFCDALQVEAAGSTTSSRIARSKGVFEDYELESALDIYATVLKKIWGSILTPADIPPEGYSMTDALNSVNCGSTRDAADCLDVITQYSWNWQVCTEIGAFQVANSSRPESLIPKFESVDNWIKDCVTYFGKTVADGPNVAPINQKYGGWNMNPTNVMWNDGEFDPWRAVTPHSTEDLSPKRPSTTNIPANGTTAGGNAFFGYVVPGGFHCPDLGNVVQLKNTTNPDVGGDATTVGANTAHTLFIEALNVWLPAFQKHSVSDVSQLTTGGDSGATPSGSDSDDDSGAVRGMVSGMGIWVTGVVAVFMYSVL